MPSRPPLQRISMSTRSIGRLAACIGVCALAFATVPALAEDASATRSAATAGAIVHPAAVDLFYRIYDAADGHPTAEQLPRSEERRLGTECLSSWNSRWA